MATATAAGGIESERREKDGEGRGKRGRRAIKYSKRGIEIRGQEQ